MYREMYLLASFLTKVLVIAFHEFTLDIQIQRLFKSALAPHIQAQLQHNKARTSSQAPNAQSLWLPLMTCCGLLAARATMDCSEDMQHRFGCGKHYLIEVFLLFAPVRYTPADDLLSKLASNNSLQHRRKAPVPQILVCSILHTSEPALDPTQHESDGYMRE